MRTVVRKQLMGARGHSTLVRLQRTFDQDSTHGYVIDLGPCFVLMQIVDENIRYNGFQAFRMCDIKRLSVPAPHAGFAKAALRLRGLRRPAKPRVTVATLSRLLASASRQYPLITIHRESVRPDVCWIGQLVAVNSRELSLLEVTPDATWEDTPRVYRCSEVTRVDFGGGYEEALALVAGHPPDASPPKGTRRTARKRQRRIRR